MPRNLSRMAKLELIYFYLMVCLIGFLHQACQVHSTLVQRGQNDFPLQDCLTQEIDLMFLADASLANFTTDLDFNRLNCKDSLQTLNSIVQTPTNLSLLDLIDNICLDLAGDTASLPVYNAKAQKSFLAVLEKAERAGYHSQVSYFSQLIDIFTTPQETDLTRVKVAFYVSKGKSASDPESSLILEKFNFRIHTNKLSAKKAIERDFSTTVKTPSTIEAVKFILTDLYHDCKTGSRPNAVKVLVVAVNHFVTVNHQWFTRHCAQAFNSTNIRVLFVAFSYMALVPILPIFPRNNVIDFIPQPEAKLTKTSLVLCSFCDSQNPGFSAQTASHCMFNTSCYKLLVPKDNARLADGKSLCEGAGSRIIAIETLSEFNYIKASLPYMLTGLAVHANNVSDTGEYVDIFIGLEREEFRSEKEMSQVRKQFHWVNKFPLVYTNWAINEPSGGYSNACVVWRYRLHSPDTAPSGNGTSGAQRLFKEEGWHSVQCGLIQKALPLCELQSGVEPKGTCAQTLISVHQGPSLSSLAAAVMRGELGLFGKLRRNSFIASASWLLKKSALKKKPSHTAIFRNKSYNDTISPSVVPMFSCGGMLDWVPYTFVCDRNQDCTDGRDETFCIYPRCNQNTENQCVSGECYPKKSKCDLYRDCMDGTDEVGCECRHGRCSDDKCFPKHWFADGETDCSTNSPTGVKDEFKLSQEHRINECVLICNNTQCLYPEKIGDGVVDCQGQEGPLDELLGQLENTSCYDQAHVVLRYSNWAPKCVYIKDQYKSIIGCRNLVHLQNCENYTCPEGYVKCPGSYCIPVHYVNNGEYECPQGEDEITKLLNCTGYFRCVDSDVCLHPDRVCDHFPHCPKGDDEINCDTSCAPGFFCLAGVVAAYDYDRATTILDLNFIDRRTRYLDLSDVNLSKAFSTIVPDQLSYVIKANLSNCSIQTVEQTPGFTTELPAVVWMDFSYNLLRMITNSSIFASMKGLQTLNLSHNYHLEYLDCYSFESRDSHLKDLDLSYTRISNLCPQLLGYMKNLARLNLRGTHITELGPDMFPGSFSIVELDLRDMDIQHFSANTFKNLTILGVLYTDMYQLCCPQIHNKDTKIGTCKAPKDLFSSCSDLMSEMVLRLLLWANGTAAVLGNLVVIVYRLGFDRTVLQMAYGHYVTHLGIADLMMGTYLLMIASVDIYFRGTYIWNESAWRRSILCKVAGFLSTLAIETSAFYILLITVDRFLIIKFPFGQYRMANKLIKLCCTVSWLVGVVISLIPLLPQLSSWQTYQSNGMCLGLPLLSTRPHGWQYSAGVFIFLNCFLFTFISIGQVLIYRAMTKANIDTGIQISQGNSRRAQDFIVARNLSLIAIMDFICWFPVGLSGLLALEGVDLGADAYAWLAVFVLPINSVLNPIIYTIPVLKRKWREVRDSPNICSYSTSSL